MAFRYSATFLFLLFLTAVAPRGLSAQSWQWASGAGGAGNDMIGGLAVDSLGNTYVVGTFEGNITFNTTTFANGPGIGLFLAKYDPLGELLWATYAAGGNFQNPSISITRYGDVFITGSFSGQVVFGSDVLRSLGGTDIFVARYDSNGVRQWVRRDGTRSTEVARGIVVNPATEVIITGYYQGSTSIDTASLANAGGSDIFIAKYAGNGAPRWAVRAGGSGSEQSRAIALDNVGNIFLAGVFTGVTVLGGDTITSAGGSDGFVAKFSPTGGPIWSTPIGGSGNDSVMALVADRFGNSYVAGMFTDTIMIGADRLGSFGLTDAFIAKIDGPGDLRWGRQGGGHDSDVAVGIALDPVGSVYLTGHFYDSARFGSVPLDDTSGNGDVFAVKYDGSGAVQWARAAGGLGFDQGRGIGIDPRGDIRVAGIFSDGAMFGSNQVGSGGNVDIFVARIGPDPAISTGEIVVGPFCPGARFNVPFTPFGIYSAENTFTAQLSDSAGNFDDALAIGRITARQGTLVPAMIPADILPGSRYRIRVVSTDPAVVGSATSAPITINPIPAPVITAGGPLTICGGSSVRLDAGAGYRSYRWSNGLTTRTIDVTEAGDYTVTVTNTSGCAGTSFAVPVRVTAPEKPAISRSGGMLESTPGGAYRWSLNGAVIPGATSRSYQPAAEGIYTVTITDTAGCSATSDPFFFSTLDVASEPEGPGLSLYPHPNRGIFTVELSLPRPGVVAMTLSDALGRTVGSWRDGGDAGIYRRTLDITGLPAGIYLLRVESGEMSRTRKVVKE